MTDRFMLMVTEDEVLILQLWQLSKIHHYKLLERIQYIISQLVRIRPEYNSYRNRLYDYLLHQFVEYRS